MFRKPMRLEKWIAFDGAFVDVLDAAHDNTADNDAEENAESHYGDDIHDGTDDGAETGLASQDAMTTFSPLSISDSTSSSFTVRYDNWFWATVTVRMPSDVSTDNLAGKDSFLPFWDSDDVRFSTGSGYYYADGRDFFFEISKPTDGSFSFYTMEETGYNNSDQSVADQFIRDHGLHESMGNNKFIAVANGESNGFTKLSMLRPVKEGSLYVFKTTTSGGDSGGTAYYQETDDGCIRFKITQKAYTSYGNGVAEAVLRSLVFSKDGGTDPQKVTGFTMGVFYKENASNNTSGLQELFDDDSGNSVFTETPQGGITVGGSGGGVDPEPPPPEPPPETPDPEPTDPVLPEIPDPGPGIDPIPDPDGPDPEPDIPDPFVPPIIDGGQGGDSYGEAGDGPDSGNMGDDVADGSADAADGGDALVYIYRREEEFAEGSDNAGDVRDPDLVEAELIAVEDRALETAATAAALELMRDMESLLQSVRGERELLEQVLAQLQQEYLLRNASEWGALREALRRLFESGNREKDAINRVLGEMHRQIGGYKRVSSEYRDGMLTESLRELVDSAARRSGETGALAKALSAVVNLLRDSRLHNDAPPSEPELSELFAASHANAREHWLARAAHSDPMGRELAATAE